MFHLQYDSDKQTLEPRFFEATGAVTQQSDRISGKTFDFLRAIPKIIDYSGFHLSEVQIYPRWSATGCGFITFLCIAPN
ncbi:MULTISPECIES: hypothetical protein [Nostocales]|uniref:Uncharacterized protein n=3 Tax=Nostocales TaxID=1161 RepID=A0A0C1RJS1_9CYAN|nr:hypothetical protein [Tolypothrix bouteillei]KAF3890424.1 hypothetical protein DA73_0400036975 [Tolypothrix bouteillei VB521301]